MSGSVDWSTIMTSKSVPVANKRRAVMAGNPFAKKGAKDADAADDKKEAKGKPGKFKAAFSKKFGDKAPPNA